MLSEVPVPGPVTSPPCAKNEGIVCARIVAKLIPSWVWINAFCAANAIGPAIGPNGIQAAIAAIVAFCASITACPTARACWAMANTSKSSPNAPKSPCKLPTIDCVAVSWSISPWIANCVVVLIASCTLFSASSRAISYCCIVLYLATHSSSAIWVIASKFAWAWRNSSSAMACRALNSSRWIPLFKAA